MAQGQGAKTLTPTGLFVPQLETWPDCGFLSVDNPSNFLSVRVDALLTAQRHRSSPIRNMVLERAELFQLVFMGHLNFPHTGPFKLLLS